MRSGWKNIAYLFGENGVANLPFPSLEASIYQSSSVFQNPLTDYAEFRQQIKRLKSGKRKNFLTIIRGFKFLGVFLRQSW